MTAYESPTPESVPAYPVTLHLVVPQTIVDTPRNVRNPDEWNASRQTTRSSESLGLASHQTLEEDEDQASSGLGHRTGIEGVIRIRNMRGNLILFTLED